MTLEPIHDNIIFKFDDKTKNGHFLTTSDSGIVVDLGGDHETSAKLCRIGTIVSVGLEAQDRFSPGEKIAIEPLMWTTGFKFEGEEYWMTQPRVIVGKVS